MYNREMRKISKTYFSFDFNQKRARTASHSVVSGSFFYLICEVEMKRKWTKETAEKYVALVERGRAPMGLKYLSAKDYLKYDRIHSKYSIIGI